MVMKIDRMFRELICCLAVLAGCAGYDSRDEAAPSREEVLEVVSLIQASGDGETIADVGPVSRVTEDEFSRIAGERVGAPSAPGGAEPQLACWRWDPECVGCCHGNVCCTYCRGIPGCY